jgi:two-component system, cell cycle sensor histidine kinase and response regulator CckA
MPTRRQAGSPHDSAPAAPPEGGRDGVSAFAIAQTLESLAASEGIAVFSTDVEGRITSWGSGAEALYGWTAEEAIGDSVLVTAPSELRGEVEAARRRLRNGETIRSWECERVRRDGKRVLVRVDLAPIRDESGEVAGVAALHYDITEQRRVEDALRAAEERYRMLVETMPLATYLVTLDEPSRALYVSPRASELCGVPLADLTPSRMRDLLHPDDRDRVLAEMVRANDAQAPLTLEYRIVRPDGTVLWLEDTSLVLAGEDGSEPRAQGYLLDISERKRLEEQLLQAQKMDAVGQLAGGIAHDFNNILTAIEGYTEFALERVSGDEKLRDDLLEVRKAAARASTLTAQILAFARRQVVRARALDLNDVIDETKRLILRLIGEHIAVASHLEVPLGTVMADPSQLTQVIVNLAVNGRDAMPDGGRLTIETTNVLIDAAEAAVLGLEPGAFVALSVGDTGLGMDPATANRAFEPFFTTKPVGEGSGLGLSTVYGIARQSGGGVAIESQPGRGTVVRVYLPRIDADAIRVDETEAHIETARGDGTILLVEDEAVIRRLAAEMLERQGYTVLTAADPQTALEIAAAEPEIDLLLTDVVMPQMNGSELARRLVAERPSLRVLFTSGYPADAIAGRGLLDDEATLLCKPFSSAELVVAVRDVLS